MNSLPHEKLIEALGQARLDAGPVPAHGNADPAPSEDEGYALQARLAEWFTREGQGAAAGYKIGATTDSMQAYLGVDGPAYGRIMQANIFASGAEIGAGRLYRPGVECELAVRIGRDVPMRPSGWSRGELADHIESLSPAIEVVENRYGDFLSAGFGTLVADDFFHKACVIGDAVKDWRAIGLSQANARTFINGREIAAGDGGQVMGHPLEPLAWLVSKLQAHGRSLKAGDIVLTGSMTPVIWVEAFPAEIRIEIGGLGDCAVTLA